MAGDLGDQVTEPEGYDPDERFKIDVSFEEALRRLIGAPPVLSPEAKAAVADYFAREKAGTATTLTVEEAVALLRSDEEYQTKVRRIRRAMADGTYVGTPTTDEDLSRLRREAEGVGDTP